MVLPILRRVRPGNTVCMALSATMSRGANGQVTPAVKGSECAICFDVDRGGSNEARTCPQPTPASGSPQHSGPFFCQSC